MDDVWAMLREPSTEDDALNLLRERCAAHPTDPVVLFDLAGAYDMTDREAEAETAYAGVEALGLAGLSSEDQMRWFVQFGSTLRLLGKLNRSREVLLRGLEAFPESQAIAAFLALTEISDGRPSQAARGLLASLLRWGAADIDYYRGPLTRYVAELDDAP
jgi:thioredoxin-like negative regulator of GroEL